MDVPAIRPATEADLQRLVVVEVEAGQLFHTVGMSEVARDVPEVEALRAAMEAERIWVTQEASEVAGYVIAEVLDGNAHIAQVSVAPTYAGRAIGKRMIEFVESWGRTAGRPATTLTTFREVPWNGPYYLRLGYRVSPSERIGPELARTMAHEASLPGIDASLRCDGQDQLRDVGRRPATSSEDDVQLPVVRGGNGAGVREVRARSLRLLPEHVGACKVVRRVDADQRGAQCARVAPIALGPRHDRASSAVVAREAQKA